MQAIKSTTRDAIVDFFLDVSCQWAQSQACLSFAECSRDWLKALPFLYLRSVRSQPRWCHTRLEFRRSLHPPLRRGPHYTVSPMGTFRRSSRNPWHDPHNHPHQFPRRTKCHSRRNDRVAAASLDRANISSTGWNRPPSRTGWLGQAIASASRSSTSPTKTACIRL